MCMYLILNIGVYELFWLFFCTSMQVNTHSYLYVCMHAWASGC